MRTKMPTLLIHLALALCCSTAWGQPGAAKTPAAGKKPAADAPEPLRFPINPQRAPYYAKIDSVGKDGAVQISAPENVPQPPAEMRSEIIEGYYIGVVQESFGKSLEGARLVRVLVIDVGVDGVVQLQLAKPATEALKPGEFLMLFRPIGATTARLKQLPDVAPLEEGAAPGETKKEDGEKLKLGQSFNNLKQIGLAFHNFHDAFKHFPPAVVMGPDEKPWHSWRIFLLPYIEQAELYNQYKFDEPWNGPNNKKLLDKMPTVYADPIHGENKDFYTHYVAITGDGMAFSAEGAEFDGKELGTALTSGMAIRNFTDGTSNTLLIGPVGPDRKIPWMKPEDIIVDDKFPELGKKGSFALPFKTDKGNAGPFLRCDGSVAGILDSIDKDTFRSLLTLNGGEVIGEYPTVNPPKVAGRAAPVIYIITEGKKTVARLVMEALEPMPIPLPPAGVPGAAPAPNATRARPVPPTAPAIKK